MYTYELSNNHYIVNIEGYKFLLDTGSPVSFSLRPGLNSVVINGKTYPLRKDPFHMDMKSTLKLVGTRMDGFIGMDIICQTSLTIYKDGRIDFKANNEKGIELELASANRVKCFCNDVVGAYLIDTGARYGYGIERLFQHQKPFGNVSDYNPFLGHFRSDMYHVTVDFGKVKKEVDVCNSPAVRNDLVMTNSIIVANLTTLFDEVCVIDEQEQKLILR